MLLIVDKSTFVPVSRANTLEEAKQKIQKLKTQNPDKDYYVKQPN